MLSMLLNCSIVPESTGAVKEAMVEDTTETEDVIAAMIEEPCGRGVSGDCGGYGGGGDDPTRSEGDL
jgi:hypothetical protein